MVNERVDTKFYRTKDPKDMPLFSHRLYWGRDIGKIIGVSIQDRSVGSDAKMMEGEYQETYHLEDCTVCVTSSVELKNTITGRESAIPQAKSALENLTSLELVEINVLAGEK